LNRPTPLPARAWRLTRMALHVVRGFATIAFVFPGASRERQDQMVRAWSHHVLGIFGVSISVAKPHDFDQLHAQSQGKRLFIGNHVSWLDIYAVQSVTGARFVAKSELAAWPVLGRLMRNAGTVFIERNKRADTLRINQTVREHLEGGTVIAIFPEGTTSDGRDVLKFHGNLLQAAMDAGAEIVPFCLRYMDAQGHFTDTPAYYGDMTMWQSIKLVLRQRKLHVDLAFFSPLAQEQRSRRELAMAAQTMIRERVLGHTAQDR
jgi:1-acyl-sn-glycerol-3-phosphate acyltransferase